MRAEWILVNLGTPEAPTPKAVKAFLREFLSDPLVVDLPRWLWLPVREIVLARRAPRTAELYGAIWTTRGSPLAAATARIRALAAAAVASDVRVSAAYRYGRERLDHALARAAGRARDVVVTALFPQPTASSSGTIAALARATARRKKAQDRIRMAALAPDAPGYIAAVAEGVRVAESRIHGRPDHLVVSFHGIPVRADRREQGGYRAACERTYAALLAALGRSPRDATLAFQSRFGPGAWLEPATADVLVERARAGARRIVVSAPGFLTPCLETLEELAMRGRRAFLDAGGLELALADAPGDHPQCVRALVESSGL